MSSVSPPTATYNNCLWTNAELDAIIDEAHRNGAKVSAHATSHAALKQLGQYGNGDGVDSIEHGSRFFAKEPEPYLPAVVKTPNKSLSVTETNTALQLLARTGAFWSPTLATYEWHGGEEWELAQQAFREALAWNKDVLYKTTRKDRRDLIKFACGGDTGVFAHGKNAREMVCMVNLGAKPLDVLSWATLEGWRCLRPPVPWTHIPIPATHRLEEEEERRVGEAFVKTIRDSKRSVTRAQLGDNAVPFGAIRPGFAADIIALGGKPGELETDDGFEGAVSAENVQFVMKGGRVWKRDGVFQG